MFKGLLIGGGVLVAGTLLYFALKKKVVSKLDTIGGNEKTKTQNLIYNVLADAGFKSQLKGMNAEQAKQFVFTAVVRGNGITKGGVYSEYNYPGIESALTTSSTQTPQGSKQNIGDTLAGLAKLGNEVVSVGSAVDKFVSALADGSNVSGVQKEYGVNFNCF